MRRQIGNEGPTQRQLRVGEQIRHILADILNRGELRDPRLRDVAVTLTEVRVTADLRSAYIYFMPLGGDGVESVLDGFSRAKSFMRKKIGKKLALKYVPDLCFLEDDTFKEVDRVTLLLRDPHVTQDTDKADSNYLSPLKSADE